MESKDTTSKVEEQGLKNVKSHYIILKFFEYLTERKYLETIRYSKRIQKRINININHFKAYYETKTSIELDIIPMKGKYDKFININEEDKKYYHIYFNDNKKQEIENTSLCKDDIVSKITIIIDYQIKSFKGLFSNCECIESIYFKKIYRNNKNNTNDMFFFCSSLKELNLNNFNTNNVTDMSGMFYGCSSLKELNLNNFITNNVTDMSCMFSKLSDELKLKIKSKYKKFIEDAFEDYED